MPDPDPWDFSEFADPDPRQPRSPANTGSGAGDPFATSGPPAGPGQSAASDPFGANRSDGEAGSGQVTADWTGYGGDSGYGVESGTVQIARPPLPYLAAAAAISLVALLLAALLGAIPGLAIIAWVLAGPIAIGVLAYYLKVDTTERARPIYAAPNWLRPAYIVALVLCGIAVVIAALRIALWVGRL